MSRENMNVAVRVFIRGPFRIEAHDGTDLTPKLRKSQGLIALLSTSDRLYRTRAWLQDKLWSDRGPDQAASSLRQALTDIRRSLGQFRTVIKSDRTGISLDLDTVEIVTDSTGQHGITEYFEGLDVRDAEFDVWLSSLRANDDEVRPAPSTRPLFSPTLAKTANLPPQIVFHSQNRTKGETGFVETALIELVLRNLREQVDVEVHFSPPATLRADALLAEIQGFATQDGSFGIRSAVFFVHDGSVQWTGNSLLPSAPSYDHTPPELFAASAQLSNGLIEVLSRPRNPIPTRQDADANLLALLGMQKVFTLRPEEACETGKLLSEAFERHPKGVYLAWLAQLNTIEYIEGIRPREETANAAEARIARALEMEPNNSQVLTVAANCTMVYNRNAQLAGHMAKMAVRSNPANAMAWWVLAHIELYNGQYEDSYVTSLRGQRLAQGTNLQYWLDFQRSIAAGFCGKMNEANLLCKTTTTLRPEFRAALRFAVMLHSTADQSDLGAQSVKRLQVFENDFSTQRFVEDGDYPVGLFRRMPGYAPEKLLNLAV